MTRGQVPGDKPIRRFLSLASKGGLVYLGLMSLLALLQRHFIYFPSRLRQDELLHEAESKQVLPWRDSQGLLIGWQSQSVGARSPKRLVVFHGNGGHALHRNYYIHGFRAVSPGDWQVLLLEYPGYGSRSGQLSEATILEAGRQAISELIPDGPVFLLGESLGSGVAARLAAEYAEAVRGVFLVTPFTRLTDVASRHYPWIPVHLLLFERYEVQDYLKEYPGPVAMLMAGRDEVVPADVGRQLFEKHPGPKRLWIQPDAGHNTLDFSPHSSWWQEVADFLTK